MSSLPSGTVTFLFTDIEGSTKLAQAHPDLWESLRERHHAILQSAIDAHDGYVFQIIGDAFCAAFHTAKDGLNAALDAQHKLTKEPWGETPIKVRMGLHTGTAGRRENDYRGYLTMARVQRVMSTAYGGQILLSNASAELIRGELPEGVTLRDMKENRLKGLLNPEHLWQVATADLPQNFPPLATLNSIPNNLPIQVTSFIGREQEIAEVKQLLSTVRLLTLTGSGGTGKTRLSLHAAAEVLDTFKHGVWFIELASLSDPALVPFAITSMLGLREEPGRSLISTLLDWFSNRELLLILDNCEHLIEACADFANRVLHSSPATRILATSREALGISGETIFRVPSLQSPKPEEKTQIEQLEQYAAVRLFVDRATQSFPTFRVTNANAPAVAQICSRLDGIPLAIELAAARVKSLSVEKIAERLDDRFRLLTGGSRTALPRQQTLRSMIDWSHSLLSEPERILFRRLSVFAGGWTLEAAEKVCADENELSLYDVLDLLTRLIDKSLFILNGSRYEVLETTRQYAREKLLDSEEVEMLRNQHLDYFLTLARQADREIHGPVQATWIDRLDMEVDNCRTALEWCMLEQNTESALCLLGALVWPWSMRGRFRETHSWFDKIRTLSNVMDYPVPYAKLLNHMGGLQIWLTGDLRYAESLLQESQAIWLNLGIDGERDLAQTLDCLGAIALFSEGDLKTAESFFKHSFRLYQEHGDQSGMAWEVYDLGLLALEQNHYAEAERLFMESLAKFQELGEKFKAATLFNGLGELARLQGDYERAGKFYEQNLEIIRELDSPFTLEYTLNNLAWVSLRGGDFRKAQTMLKESIKLSYDQGNRSGIPVCLAGFASILGMIGKPEQAARLFGAVESIKNSFGKDMDPPDQKEFEHYVAVVRAQLDEAAFSKAWVEYQSITIERIIALALEETYE